MNSAASTNASTLETLTVDAAAPTVTKEGKMVLVRNVKERDYKHLGRQCQGAVAVGQHADILPGKSIRLRGLDKNRITPAPHDKTFQIGDTVEYDSYNLSYLGAILKITAKTVTVDASATNNPGTVKRLTIHEFNRRNRHLDLDVIARNRAEWMD